MDNMKLEEYEYDRNGNRIRIQTKESSTNQVQLEYYKNNAGGNTAMVKYDGEWWYTYDNNGNRTSKGKKLKEKGAEYITANEKENGSREGNITLDTDYEYWEYTWDLYNRLVKVEQKKDEDNDSLVCVTYKYDGLNHRIERNSILEDTKTKYVYGRNGALTYEEFIKNGTKVGTRSYSYIYDQIIGFTDNENGIQKKRYAVTDVLGTVSEIYSEENELLWKASYTAFGIPQVATTDKLEGVFEFHGMFSGCQFDEETSLSYHWNRWRNEAGNSFISEDPIRDGSNWYGCYAGQNPINFVDRKGLEEEQTTTNSNLSGDENKKTSHYGWYNVGDGFFIAGEDATYALLTEETGIDFKYLEDDGKISPGQFFYIGKENNKDATVIDSTISALQHYFNSDGESVNLGPKTIESLKKTSGYKKNQKALSEGTAKSKMQRFSVDLTMKKNSYHVGRTTIIYNKSEGSKYRVIIYTAFVDDGFWDPIRNADGKGPKGELPGGTVYHYNPYSWTEVYEK